MSSRRGPGGRPLTSPTDLSEFDVKEHNVKDLETPVSLNRLHGWDVCQIEMTPISLSY